jgi:hypothetical protein
MEQAQKVDQFFANVNGAIHPVLCGEVLLILLLSNPLDYVELLPQQGDEFGFAQTKIGAFFCASGYQASPTSRTRSSTE